jgi:two-component system response regulator PilR (NtrC family)
MSRMVRRNAEPCALVVEDEPDLLALYELSLKRIGVRTVPVADIQQARLALATDTRFDLCITDLRLPDGNGLELVRDIQLQRRDLPVAVVTAYGDVQAAVDALKAGAFDFVTKPLEPARLRQIVEHALHTLDAPVPVAQSGADVLIGSSTHMQALRQLVSKVARTQAPVFIHGESGTGKELVARQIHQSGPRAQGPFVPVKLIESELFGHRKGSFTGATADKPGLFRAAHGGTLFLDEVAELPLAVQVKLLRVLQERSIRPVGAVEEEPVDVRVLSASHKNLESLVQAGEFRHDLFYRLNVIQIDIPPLRQRPEDVPALVAHILCKLAEREGRGCLQLTPPAMQVLQTHDFKGNVRELENLLERAVALSDGNLLQVNDLWLPAPCVAETRASDGMPGGAEVSREQLLQVLQTHRWNRTKAAEALGMTLRQLRYRLGKLGMDGVAGDVNR